MPNSPERPGNHETSFEEAADRRATLHKSPLAHIEDALVSPFRPPPAGYETHHQVVLPYFGLFTYNVGSRQWLMDPNRVLFISPGWEFFDKHPVSGLGHAALIINPSGGLLDEICNGASTKSNSAFRCASRPSSMRLRLLTHHILQIPPEARSVLHSDEWVIHALREALNGEGGGCFRASNLVDRAKQVLHARGYERISLEEIASEVGASPAYLTQEFTRAEGIPMYKYHLRLRLSRALLELPHCNDITGLALDLGFSSHSHFTYAFRNGFGVTPSNYRLMTGTRQAQSRLMEILDNGSPSGR
jgi:AraC family transcriptional regulator